MSDDKRLAARIGRLGTESAFEVLARARALEAQGRKVVHLEIGEPDFDTPLHIIDAAADAALRSGFTHYGPPPQFAGSVTLLACGSDTRGGMGRRIPWGLTCRPAICWRRCPRTC